MIASIYRIYLDVHEAHSGLSLDVKKADTARKIYITLTDGGFPYQISRECYAVFAGTKPDGKIIRTPCVIDGNTVIYQMTPQTTAVVGAVECEIRLYGADDMLITSPGFSIVVNETAYTEGDEVESETEVNALIHLISEATTVITKGEEVNERSDALIQDMEDKREILDQQIGETRVYSEEAKTARKQAETAQADASRMASVAESAAGRARGSADQARLHLESVKSLDESAKLSATNAKNSGNEAKVSAAQASNSEKWAKAAADAADADAQAARDSAVGALASANTAGLAKVTAVGAAESAEKSAAEAAKSAEEAKAAAGSVVGIASISIEEV